MVRSLTTFSIDGQLINFIHDAGVQLVLYIACMRILYRRESRLSATSYFLMSLITVLCAMDTIWTATSAIGLQLTYIDYRNYPGGPLAFLGIEFSMPVNIVSLASYITGNIIADALLVRRLLYRILAT